MNIEIPKEFPQIIPENIYKSINEIEPEIQKLDEFSILLTLRFMKSTIESIYNYSKICFVIAIDNSRAINIYDKLINLLISISLCRCFYYLEIPFSIVIFSDYIYQFVIKDFKEKFSIQTIQKIYDSIIVERYFTRIFDVCYYIQKKIEFPNECQNRIALIISNGIDVNLNVGNQWRKYLNSNIEYCFFFNKGQETKNENMEKIMNIWKEFEKYSNIPIIDFNLEEILYNQVKLFKFENLLKSLKEQKEEETPEGDEFDPKYMEDFDYIIDDFSMGIFDKDILYNKKNETFIKIGKQEKITKKIFIFPIQIRNNFIIQLKEKIEEDKIKIFLNCFESKIPLINQKLIDKIFPPNKPTHYAPSAKGSKLNISGLLNFFMTHGQENKI